MRRALLRLALRTNRRVIRTHRARRLPYRAGRERLYMNHDRLLEALAA